MAEHYPKFRDRRAAEERSLPRYGEDEFEAYLKCGRLEHGFLRVKCDIERIVEHLGRDAAPVDAAHPSRAPPQGDLSL